MHAAGLTVQRSGSGDCEPRFHQTAINHDGTVTLCCAACIRHNLHYTRPELTPGTPADVPAERIDRTAPAAGEQSALDLCTI